MFIDNFKRKKKVHPSFCFAYELESNGTPKHVFWADSPAQLNYAYTMMLSVLTLRMTLTDTKWYLLRSLGWVTIGCVLHLVLHFQGMKKRNHLCGCSISFRCNGVTCLCLSLLIKILQ